jgi:molecular chaperone GrpE (heat shock protein)
MTIKQYAAEHKVSPQAVYQRLKKNKIRVETLTENGSGELTGEGIVILDKLFNPENRAIKPLKDEKIEALEAQLAAIKADNEAKQAKIDLLTQRAEELKQDKENYFQALLKSQDALADHIKRLGEGKPSGGGSERLTWRERFTGRRKC